jgi:hypothetical protein
VRWIVLLVLCSSACADEPGRYDAQTVLELVRSRGDALGTAHTGVWATTIEELDCDCPELSLGSTIPAVIEPCTAIIAATTDFSSPWFIEADGVLHMRFATLELLGRIDDDGEIALGEVSSLSNPAVSIRTVLRLDGSIVDHDRDARTGVWAELDGELVARFDGKLAERGFRCGAEYELHGELASSYVPPD